jgi:hypothetical protein
MTRYVVNFLFWEWKKEKIAHEKDQAAFLRIESTVFDLELP